MGTVYTVKISGTNLPSASRASLQKAVDDRLHEINRQMSHYQPDSEISRFNRAPANVAFSISPEFTKVMRFALELNRLSNGAFDPTLGPVVNLWGFGEKSSQQKVPNDKELQSALAKTGCQHLKITDKNELIKDIPELSLNLSAIAKGYGTDAIIQLLIQNGFTNCYASIAGEVRVLGQNPRGNRWQIGVASPVTHWNEDNSMATVVSLSDQAISTSGDYQKFFTDPQGRRLCHIIDPSTGWPVQNKVGGVSVIATNSMTADALSTVLFVMGPDKGLKFIEAWTHTAAIFILRESENSYRQISSSRFSRWTQNQ